MKTMIQSYENSRAGLQERIRELNTALHDKALRTREREKLEQRREQLRYETIEMMRIIADLRAHL